MAKFIISLDKSDIKTSPIGDNIMIDANNVQIIFTKPALKELIEDYKCIILESQTSQPFIKDVSTQ